MILDVEAMGRQEDLKELGQPLVKLETGLRSMVLEEMDIGRKYIVAPDVNHSVSHVTFNTRGVILITGGLGALGVEVNFKPCLV